MTDEKFDNPVGRLVAILHRAKERSSDLGKTEARIGWAVVFELQGHQNSPSRETEVEICWRLIELRKLIAEAEKVIQQSEAPHAKRYLRPFARLRTMVPLTDLSGAFAVPINEITESDMDLLEMASDELSSRHSESVVEEGELEALREQIDELFDRVKQSDLDEDLKIFILNQLESIRRAIAEYQIRGTERLQEALAEIVGGYFLHQEIIEKESDKEEVGIYKQLLSHFYSVVLTAAKLTPLIGPASKVFGFLTAGTPNIPPVDLGH